MSRPHLCEYHQAIHTRACQRLPKYHFGKSARKRMARNMNMSCLECQGRPRVRERPGRDPE